MNRLTALSFSVCTLFLTACPALKLDSPGPTPAPTASPASATTSGLSTEGSTVFHGDGYGNDMVLDANGELAVLTGTGSQGIVRRFDRDLHQTAEFHTRASEQILVQSDGHVLLRNRDDHGTAVVIQRYDMSGGPDRTFGSNGEFTLSWLDPLRPSQMTIDARDEIFVSGTRQSTGYLTRFPSDAGAYQTHSIVNFEMSALALSSTGDITVGGGDSQRFFGTNYRFDQRNDFGSFGLATLASPNVKGYPAIGAQSNDKVVILGVTNSGVVLSRLDDKGHLDATFGVMGSAELNQAMAADWKLFIGADDSILVGATIWTDATPRISVRRLTRDGRFDASFGIAGEVSIAFDSAGAMLKKVVSNAAGEVYLLAEAIADKKVFGTLVLHLDANGHR